MAKLDKEFKQELKKLFKTWKKFTEDFTGKTIIHWKDGGVGSINKDEKFE